MPIDLGTKVVTLKGQRQITMISIDTGDLNQIRVSIGYVETEVDPDGKVVTQSDPKTEAFTKDQLGALPGFAALYDANKTAFYALLGTRVQ
jgi:hypothetical protein